MNSKKLSFKVNDLFLSISSVSQSRKLSLNQLILSNEFVTLINHIKEILISRISVYIFFYIFTYSDRDIFILNEVYSSLHFIYYTHKLHTV